MSGERVLFENIVPYDVPSSLNALSGPDRGEIDVPLNVYWGPRSKFDLDNPSDRAQVYRAVIRVGRSIDQEALLNERLLLDLWPSLWLPIRCRQTWEAAFPQLLEKQK